MSNYLGFKPAVGKDYYFISYNSEDAHRVGEYCTLLHEEKIPLWYDYGIPYDEKWESVISRKIRDCRKVILFYTEGVGKKKNSWVKKEYMLAHEFNKQVVVVMLDSPDASKAHVDNAAWIVELKDRQSIPCEKLYPVEKGVREIRNALDKRTEDFSKKGSAVNSGRLSVIRRWMSRNSAYMPLLVILCAVLPVLIDCGMRFADGISNAYLPALKLVIACIWSLPIIVYSVSKTNVTGLLCIANIFMVFYMASSGSVSWYRLFWMIGIVIALPFYQFTANAEVKRKAVFTVCICYLNLLLSFFSWLPYQLVVITPLIMYYALRCAYITASEKTAVYRYFSILTLFFILIYLIGHKFSSFYSSPSFRTDTALTAESLLLYVFLAPAAVQASVRYERNSRIPQIFGSSSVRALTAVMFLILSAFTAFADRRLFAITANLFGYSSARLNGVSWIEHRIAAIAAFFTKDCSVLEYNAYQFGTATLNLFENSSSLTGQLFRHGKLWFAVLTLILFVLILALNTIPVRDRRLRIFRRILIISYQIRWLITLLSVIGAFSYDVMPFYGSAADMIILLLFLAMCQDRSPSITQKNSAVMKKAVISVLLIMIALCGTLVYKWGNQKLDSMMGYSEGTQLADSFAVQETYEELLEKAKQRYSEFDTSEIAEEELLGYILESFPVDHLETKTAEEIAEDVFIRCYVIEKIYEYRYVNDVPWYSNDMPLEYIEIRIEKTDEVTIYSSQQYRVVMDQNHQILEEGWTQ